jgi:hypothetical protein
MVSVYVLNGPNLKLHGRRYSLGSARVRILQQPTKLTT